MRERRSMEENIIELQKITKIFEEDSSVGVENINLKIKKGEFVTFLGPSGCGKTTTLRMIAGLDLPTKGKILLNGKDISNTPPYLRPINTVFQSYALFPHMNVSDNISFGLKLKNESKDSIQSEVRRVLKIVDLEGFEKRKIDTLSGGQQQRIAIARAIVNKPQILLLDEPLGALDLKMRKEMQLELKSMHETLGITFIYVTHDQEEALTLSDKIVVMADGRVQQAGTPEDIYNEPENAFVANMIGDSNIYNGIMTGKRKVTFCETEFDCLDDFKSGSHVDVVVRPEDIAMVSPEAGQFSGKVCSVIFKGMHYETTVLTERNEVVIQSTKSRTVGDTIGMLIEPDGIHCMPVDTEFNHFDGMITRHNTVRFADGEFEISPDISIPSGTEVDVTISIKDITMSDDESEGGVRGNILSMIYKGNHYNYSIRTKNGFVFVLEDKYLWNENDYVSLIIPAEKIQMKRKDNL
ncbi:MAG: ABC transporter ATP-binding protein [Lachnoclostridium sp.]|nr:ABC transporter ATP-binding protein [Lachnoclostridium sp.]